MCRCVVRTVQLPSAGELARAGAAHGARLTGRRVPPRARGKPCEGHSTSPRWRRARLPLPCSFHPAAAPCRATAAVRAGRAPGSRAMAESSVIGKVGVGAYRRQVLQGGQRPGLSGSGGGAPLVPSSQPSHLSPTARPPRIQAIGSRTACRPRRGPPPPPPRSGWCRSGACPRCARAAGASVAGPVEPRRLTTPRAPHAQRTGRLDEHAEGQRGQQPGCVEASAPQEAVRARRAHRGGAAAGCSGGGCRVGRWAGRALPAPHRSCSR
jgi:hypothetical protein